MPRKRILARAAIMIVVFAAISAPFSAVAMSTGGAQDPVSDTIFYVAFVFVPIGFFMLFTAPWVFLLSAAILIAWYLGLAALLRRTRLGEQAKTLLAVLSWPVVTIGSNFLLYLVYLLLDFILSR